MAREASSTDQSPFAPVGHPSASTPPNPPPRGEGFERFAGPERIKPGGVKRAKRPRSAPTYTEAKLWDRLRVFDVRFRRQAPIGPYVVDFACLRKRFVVEVDGGVHERSDVAVRDLKRDDWLASQGFGVLRVSAKRVEDDIDGVVDEIAKAVGAFVPPGAVRSSFSTRSFPLGAKGPNET